MRLKYILFQAVKLTDELLALDAVAHGLITFDAIQEHHHVGFRFCVHNRRLCAPAFREQVHNTMSVIRCKITTHTKLLQADVVKLM